MPDNKTMSLDEFCERRAKELEQFKRDWLVSHAEDPANWPLKFTGSAEAEWDEQFVTWLSLNGAEDA